MFVTMDSINLELILLVKKCLELMLFNLLLLKLVLMENFGWIMLCVMDMNKDLLIVNIMNWEFTIAQLLNVLESFALKIWVIK